jgi:hypothetical protein
VGRREIHKVKNDLTKLTKLHKSEALKKSRFSRANLIVFAIIFASIGGYFIYSSFAATTDCSGITPATPATYSAQLGGAQPGQTLCLSSGTYTWVQKTSSSPGIKIVPTTGATVVWNSFIDTSAWVTLDGSNGLMRYNSVEVCAQSHDFTITYGTFIPSNNGAVLTIHDINGYGNCGGTQQMSNSNIMFDHLILNDINVSSSSQLKARIHLPVASTNPAGITIQNSELGDTDGNPDCATDGIQNGANGVTIQNNYFHDLQQGDGTCQHTDPIQLYGSQNTTVRNNYVINGDDSFVSFDCCQVNDQIYNNLIVGITGTANTAAFYSDTNSSFKHNTLLLVPTAQLPVRPGTVRSGNKVGDPPNSNLNISDNLIAGINQESGTIVGSHNLCSGGCSAIGTTGIPAFVGGTDPILKYALTSGSLGKAGSATQASDGTDVGANVATVGIDAGSGSTTPPPPPPPTDTTPPTISVTAPTVGAIVSGSSVALSANASDPGTNPSGVSSVQFKVDGANAGPADTTAPYSITWDSRTATNGSHTITAVATDAAGNTTTSSSVSITTNNTTSCSTSTTAWQNSSFASQTGSFTFDFDATPSANGINSVVGLNNTTAAAYTDLAAIVRFNASGFIDAASGNAGASVYTSDVSAPYTAGTSYHFKLTVNPTAHTYTVVVTPNGSSAINLATNYPFRTSQATLSTFSNWALVQDPASTGSAQVCGATLNQSTGPKPGDINNDNSVNITDLSLLLSSYNQNTTQCATNNTYKCDLSSPGDGVVNIFDLSILLSHYGT